jgi:hypothetical protein
MDFYIGVGDNVLHLPMNPEKSTVQRGAKVHTFSEVERGDVAYVRGSVPGRLTMSGIFPGDDFSGLSIMKDWRPPDELIYWLSQWSAQGTVVTVSITESEVAQWQMYIQDMSTDLPNGYGSVAFTINFFSFRDVRVGTFEELTAASTATSAGATRQAARADEARPKTHVVVSGDTLYDIAIAVYGDSSKWHDIYTANADLIGPDPDAIQVGQELVLP